LNIYPKYKNGSNVSYQEEKNGDIKIGQIVGIRAYQSRHFRPECWMITYLVMPEEYWNCECDEEIEIPEAHGEFESSGVEPCYPRILN
jgi:hypothetical protein